MLTAEEQADLIEAVKLANFILNGDLELHQTEEFESAIEKFNKLAKPFLANDSNL